MMAMLIINLVITIMKAVMMLLAQHVQHIEAEVHHCSQDIACHRDTDKHVYNSIAEDEKLQIAFLPQVMHMIMQQ